MAMTMPEWWWQYASGGSDIYLLHHPRLTGRIAPTPDGQRWSWRVQGADGVSEAESGTEDGAFAAAELEIQKRSTAHGRLRKQREGDG